MPLCLIYAAIPAGSQALRGLLFSAALFLFDYLYPIAVGVFDEIEGVAGLLLLTDNAHLFVAGIVGGNIVGLKRQMKLSLAEVVSVFAVKNVGKLKGEIAASVADENELIPVAQHLSHRLEAEGLVIKLKALVKVEDIEIKMVECEHLFSPFEPIYYSFSLSRTRKSRESAGKYSRRACRF